MEQQLDCCGNAPPARAGRAVMPREIDDQYVRCVKRIFDEGEYREDRTGVGTLAVFGHSFEFRLDRDFPLLAWKKTLWKAAFTEMLWFLRGDDNTAYLHEHGVHIWDEWARNGFLGPVYGVQWRAWRKPDGSSVDQIAQLIAGLRSNPFGRRHLVTAWNVGDLEQMALPPCHRSFQCFVAAGGKMDMQVDIRSSDVGLGLPFNIAQYALLAHLIARAAELSPRRLIVHTGDTHIYMNHYTPLRDWMRWHPVDQTPCPQLVFNTENWDIDGYKPDDFTVAHYSPNGFLKLPIAV